MGAKITIDSATLANKGLEVIEAHFLFGLPYDRIEVVVHPTSIVHGLVRFRDGAAIAHLGYPDMRVPISYALTYPERAATPIPALDLTAAPLEFFEPDLETFPLLALAREAGERGGTFPCAFNAANEVAVAAFLDGRIGFLEIAVAGRGRARARRRRARARPRRVARGRRPRARAWWSRVMGIVSAIVGLALLVMIHEAGHFFAARAVGMTPRKFYLGFGPPIVKHDARQVEYGIGSIPLGGYVKIPGMNRPSPGDLRATLLPEARGRAPGRAGAARRGDRVGRRCRGAAPTLEDAAAGARRDAGLAGARVGARARRVLAPGDVAPARRDRRRPGGEPALRDRPLHGPLRDRDDARHERDRHACCRAPRPPRPASRSGDRIVSVAGERVKPKDIPAHIRATEGRPFTLVVRRARPDRVAIPLRARLDHGAYRIGIAIEARTGRGRVACPRRRATRSR